MKISPFLFEDLVIPELSSQAREAVLEEIVGFLKAKGKVDKEKELFEKLYQREKLGSTAIGGGIAIPHCKFKEVKNPLVMLALSKRGVDFESLDRQPTYVFFLVVTPPDNPSLSLQVLAAIAQLVRKAVFLQKRILKAKTPKRIIEIIREEEEKFNG